ncbi:hypothetical protein RBY4I_3371 [Rhodobacterales bacterium Y4I]|nr:hypothetical protein RBY4I_3371 [Rhodobacterales bacterium Y4I]
MAPGCNMVCGTTRGNRQGTAKAEGGSRLRGAVRLAAGGFLKV